MSQNKLIYLASPYSSPNKWVQEIRERLVTAVGAELTKQGHFVYGPITESYQYARLTNLGAAWEYWGAKDLAVLVRCNAIYVLKIKGWDSSIGVLAEIEAAKKWNIPIKYLEPEDYLPGYNELFK